MKSKDYVPGLKVTCVREGGIQTERTSLEDPAKVWELAKQYIGLPGEEREHFVVFFLDARNVVKGVQTVSIGTLTASLVHPREVYRPAVVSGSAAVIVCHNHPSGDLEPSAEDREATRRIAQAGRILGVSLLDHVIVTDAGYSSFRQRGYL